MRQSDSSPQPDGSETDPMVALGRPPWSDVLTDFCDAWPGSGSVPPKALTQLRARIEVQASLGAGGLTRAMAEQRLLRQRGARKFAASKTMLFERTLLEQASSERLARWKAARFAAAIRNVTPARPLAPPPRPPVNDEQAALSVSSGPQDSDRPSAAVWDVCCGLGGDAIAFANVIEANMGCRLIVVDRSPLAVGLAGHNLAVAGHGKPCRLPIEIREASAEDILPADDPFLPSENSEPPRSEPRPSKPSPSESSRAELLADRPGAGRLGRNDWLHLDPDRRASGRRTNQGDAFSPPTTTIARMVATVRGACVKLPPAMRPDAAAEILANAPSHSVTWEWVGDEREAKQLLLWTGDLAWRPGCRAATVLSSEGTTSESLVVSETGDVQRLVTDNAGGVRAIAEPFDAKPGRSAPSATWDDDPLTWPAGTFVYDPHAAITAAELTDALAVVVQGRRVAPGVAYLLGMRAATNLAASFVLIEARVFDQKRLSGWLDGVGIGPVEIKTRGLTVAVETLARKLAGRTGPPGTLLIFPHRKRPIALLTRRSVRPESPPPHSVD